MAGKGRQPQANQQRATKAERRQEARRQRLELQRRMARARRNRRLGLATGITVGLAIAVAFAIFSGGKGSTPRTGTLPGLMTGSQPWPANTADLGSRLDSLALPPVGGAIHIHSHLDLIVDGQPVTVPADVGIAPGAESPLHTHAEDGVIHLESADPSPTFTLGEFFDVWGLRLTSKCVGGYCDGTKRSIRTFVDGKAFEGDPRSLELKDHQEIVLTFGTESEVPSPLPTFDWSKLQP